MSEQDFINGEQALARRMFSQLKSYLPAGTIESWQMERMDTILKLREICAQHGDNEWDDNLHLADILDKHLQDHLES